MLLLMAACAVVFVAVSMQGRNIQGGRSQAKSRAAAQIAAIEQAKTNLEPLFSPCLGSPVAEVKTLIRFRDATKTSGIAFEHIPTRSTERYLPEAMGGGVIVADFNRDGAPDIVLINGGSMEDPHVRPPEIRNRLYMNNGDGTFTDATDQWKLPGLAYGMGGAAGDYDNDGHVDLYLTTFGGGDQLLRNTGDHFEDVTAASGINPDQMWSTSAGFLDADQDGDLDLYIVRYVDYTKANALRCYFNTVHITCTPVLYSGVPDRLLMNNGDGTFNDVSKENLLVNNVPMVATIAQQYEPGGAAAAAAPGQDLSACKGLALTIGDINDDGAPDIYVANDLSRNLLFVNRGDGVFDEVGRSSGVAYGEGGNEQAGMGSDLSDVDGDGKVDIVCTNFQGEPVNIYCRSEGMFFVDRGDSYGFGQSTRARLKFGVKFFDANNDGAEELLIANGHTYDNVDQFLSNVTFAQPNSLFENVEKGRFVDVSEVAGDAMQDSQVSRGLAIADFNGDGAVDYVIGNNGGTAQLAVNETTERGNFMSFWLEGVAANKSAIGASIVIKAGDQTLRREVLGATSYLSASDPRLHFGLGKLERVESIEIRWPGGQTQTLPPLEINRFYRVVQGSDAMEYTPGKVALGIDP